MENLFNPNENLNENLDEQLNDNGSELNERTDNLVDKPEGSEPAKDVAFLGNAYTDHLENRLANAYEKGLTSTARDLEHRLAQEKAKEYTDSLK